MPAASDTSDKTQERDLAESVRKWLRREGYPLEFAVANAFRAQGFSTRQGQYVQDTKTQKPREIDVVAEKNDRSSGHKSLRVSYLVECKWSKDKPWVVLKSPATVMHPTACAAQSLASTLGTAIMWIIAGNEDLHQNTTLFKSDVENGFTGRQAFTKGVDLFYDSMQSITEKSLLYAESYDRPRSQGSMPRSGVVAFPLLVVDGTLFSGSYNQQTDEIDIASVDHIRCHWRGSAAWPLFATVDIVTLIGLEQYVMLRSQEIDVLLTKMKTACDNIGMYCEGSDFSTLDISPGPRGVVGLPPLLQEVERNRKLSKPYMERKV